MNDPFPIRKPARELEPSDSLEHFSRHHEGYKDKAYQDIGGIWTIGFGHTKDVHPGDRCTLAQAVMWHVNDLHQAATFVQQLVLVPLTQYEFDALVSFTNNVGGGALARSTLLRELNRGHYERAAEEFLRWDHVGDRIVDGLLHRRQDERMIFKGGKAPPTYAVGPS